jgi:ABC-type Fe3+ transport system permease subunit
LPGTALVLTFFTYPYVFLTTRASLLSFDGSIVEAARSLNHTRWEAFKRVTLPQITPGIAAGALLVALYVLADFGTPAIMKYDVFTRMIYNEFGARRLDFAAVLSLLLLVMALGILAIESRIEADRDGAYVSRGASRPGTVVLGRWRYPAVAFASSVALFCLVLPVAILTQWLVRGGQGFAGGGFTFELGYAWNSVTLAAGAAAACVLLALPVAYLAARHRTRRTPSPGCGRQATPAMRRPCACWARCCWRHRPVIWSRRALYGFGRPRLRAIGRRCSSSADLSDTAVSGSSDWFIATFHISRSTVLLVSAAVD